MKKKSWHYQQGFDEGMIDGAQTKPKRIFKHIDNIQIVQWAKGYDDGYQAGIEYKERYLR